MQVFNKRNGIGWKSKKRNGIVGEEFEPSVLMRGNVMKVDAGGSRRELSNFTQVAGRRGEENIDGMLGTALTAFFYGPLGYLIATRLSTYLHLYLSSAFCKCKTP